MIALLAPTLLGCATGLPVRSLDVGGHKVSAEIVSTPEHRNRGLMFRDSLGADKGMLFIYPDNKPRSFWMKDTRIPLDIAFADAEGKIVRIAQMQPFEMTRTSSLYPATYALEMNQGWFDAHGVTKGAMIDGIPTDLPIR